MKIKPSKFNFKYKKNEDTIVYNTFSKACVALDSSTTELLKKEELDYSENSDETIKYLKANGFL